MSTLWINSSTLRKLQILAERDFPVETGGVLVGYFADNGEVVVKDVVGPGPNAKHRRFSFVPDHAWQCQRLDEIYQSSAGIAVYLGDWHTHPDGCPKMSWADKRTLHRIASYSQARTSVPIMVIGGGGPHDWKWNCFQYQSSRIWGLSSDFNTCEFKIF